MSQPQQPTNAFVVLYCGDTIASARLVAASSDPELVQLAVAKMLEGAQHQSDDSIGAALTAGRRQALNLLKLEGGL